MESMTDIHHSLDCRRPRGFFFGCSRGECTGDSTGSLGWMDVVSAHYSAAAAINAGSFLSQSAAYLPPGTGKRWWTTEETLRGRCQKVTIGVFLFSFFPPRMVLQLHPVDIGGTHKNCLWSRVSLFSTRLSFQAQISTVLYFIFIATLGIGD